MQVHEPEAHDLPDDARRRGAAVEPRKLIGDPRRARLQPRELAIALSPEEPDPVSPVARVIPHRQQERDPTGKEVARERKSDEQHAQQERERSGAQIRDPHVRVRPEQGEAAVHHHDVPLDRDAHRHVAGDESVQSQHQHHPEDQRPAPRREPENDRHAPSRARCRRAPSTRRGATAGGRRDSRGT